MHPLVGVLGAYLLGSIPAAYVAGRMVKGIDLRQHGSGNLGATNVYRLLGGRVAATVLLFDAAKGALPVRLFPALLVDAPAGPEGDGVRMLWAIAYGVAAIAGHVRPIFLLWRGGGKGVATAAGVFAALVPIPMLIAFAAFVLVVSLSGFVSLASLSAAAVLPVAVGALLGPTTPLFLVALLVGAFVFWTHRANIDRLRRGEESRIGRRRAAAPAAPAAPAAAAGPHRTSGEEGAK